MQQLLEHHRASRLANGIRRAEGEDIDPYPVVKLFTPPWPFHALTRAEPCATPPNAGATWLLTELDPADRDLAFGLCDLGLGHPEPGWYGSKVFGNGLRELDRFLSVVIDEVAALIVPPGLDRAALLRHRNTARKLRTIRGVMAMPSPDQDRLLAIGRSRECLANCDGVVRRGDDRSAGRMTAGWRAPGEAGAKVVRRRRAPDPERVRHG